jgi:hypothetical protein
MPMTLFVDRFPELGMRETRVVFVQEGQDLPAGDYNFMELYCNERGCDCRRVTFLVLRRDTGWNKVWATIGYGWETEEFYRRWSSGHSDPVEMQGPTLDTFNQQSKYAPQILEIFQSYVLSPEYVERLKRHYRMFRDSVDREHGRQNVLEANRAANRRKRLRDPNRRRRKGR